MLVIIGLPRFASGYKKKMSFAHQVLVGVKDGDSGKTAGAAMWFLLARRFLTLSS